ncbi:DTW domain-containing protein 1 [Podila clonocystis]|nr:DTW domain-containing protein 1 [Podila clonocystis]
MTNDNTAPKGQKRPHALSSPFADFQITDTSVLDQVPKAHCPKCHRNSRYFCYKCLDLVGDFPEGSVPQLKLPIRLDIIKHEQERDGKSTALHAGVLAPRDVTVYEWSQMPQYEDVDRLLLLFPSEGAKQLSEIDPASFDKLVVIDGTWDQAKKMSKSSTLARMKRVTIAPHETLFWRYQRKASDHLATIEAIYYFLREYHETYLTTPPPSLALSTTSDKSMDEGTSTSTTTPSTSTTVVSPHAETLGTNYRYGPYDGQFDDMLWFYKYFYELIQHTYRERSDGKTFTLKHRKDYIQYEPKGEDKEENAATSSVAPAGSVSSEEVSSSAQGASTPLDS